MITKFHAEEILSMKKTLKQNMNKKRNYKKLSYKTFFHAGASQHEKKSYIRLFFMLKTPA